MVVQHSNKPEAIASDSWRTRVKICGVTRACDLTAAVDAGADAIGFVFYPPSPRALSVEQAGQLRRLVPAFVDVVALFVNASVEEIRTVIDAIQPDLLQFHGDESPEECEQFGRRYIKAFRVGGPLTDTPEKVLRAAQGYKQAVAWLFDTHSSGYGGSGLSFDHHLLAAVRKHRQARSIVLAGGLDSTTVGLAVQQLQPFAVDVSSGVERSPGIKCARRMREFMQALYGTDSISPCVSPQES